VIRPAHSDDLPQLREVERAAGSSFIDLDMRAVAEDDLPSLEVLNGYQREGRAWVATDEDDHVVAYLLVDVVDGAAHVQQVSVHPRHAGHRLGSALLDTAAAWAAQHRLATVTLTTFVEVPWNAPYYARLGFRVLQEHELTDGLRRIRKHEVALGLDRWPRTAMARPVGRDTAHDHAPSQ
jgi:GNAT superfamily N-acetyltransferase